jgi:hypothetical protein
MMADDPPKGPQDEFDFEQEKAPPRAKEIEIVLNAHPGLFQVGFDEWLIEQWHVWREFRRQADRVWDLGRRHYGARTITEWMRHHTTIAETGGAWKINNNLSPDLARLYGEMFPERREFFWYRGSKYRPHPSECV